MTIAALEGDLDLAPLIDVRRRLHRRPELRFACTSRCYPAAINYF